MVTAIIVAAGKSERMGAGTDKAFLNLGSRPVIAWSLLAFERCEEIDQIILVVRKDQLVAAKAVVRMFGISKIHAVVAGGARRQDSVMNALKELDVDTRWVVVHDGARPCVTGEMISETVKRVRTAGAVVVGRRVYDTVKYVEKGLTVSRTEDRSKLWLIQTPQAFDVRLLKKGYEAIEAQKLTVTDDASAVEYIETPVKIFECDKPNIKITTVEDLQLAGALVLKR